MTLVQAYDGYVGLGTQTSINVGVPATKFQRVQEASIAYKESARAAVDHIQKGRGYVDVMRGPIEVDGSLNGYLTPDEIFGGIGFAYLLGNSNTVSGSAAVGYTHVFTDGTLGQTAYGATIEVYKGGTAVMFDMIGMFLNKLTLTMGGNDPVTFASDWVGVKEAIAGTVSTASFNNDPPFESWMATLTYGDSLAASQTTVPLNQSVTFTYDNKMEPVRGIGSRYMVGTKYGRPDIMIDFTALLQNDATLYNLFANNTQNALTLTLTHDSLAGSASGVYSIKIELPTVFYKGDSPVLSGSSSIDQPLKAQALYNSTYGCMCRITVVNSESGAYAI